MIKWHEHPSWPGSFGSHCKWTGLLFVHHLLERWVCMNLSTRELLCYGALTKSIQLTWKFEVIQRTHSLFPQLICSCHLQPRAEVQMEDSSLCPTPNPPSLPTDHSNLHIRGYVSIHKGTRVTKSKVSHSPCHSLALSQAKGVHMAMAIFGKTDPKKKPKQDLAFSTGQLAKMVCS